jgi:hypothetical protein
MVSDEQIRELAYYIWQREGYLEGKATEHYFRAKQMLEAQESTSSKNMDGPLPATSAEIPKLKNVPIQKQSGFQKTRSKKDHQE